MHRHVSLRWECSCEVCEQNTPRTSVPSSTLYCHINHVADHLDYFGVGFAVSQREGDNFRKDSVRGHLSLTPHFVVMLQDIVPILFVSKKRLVSQKPYGVIGSSRIHTHKHSVPRYPSQELSRPTHAYSGNASQNKHTLKYDPGKHTPHFPYCMYAYSHIPHTHRMPPHTLPVSNVKIINSFIN